MNFVQRSSGAAYGCWSWRTRLLDVVTLGLVLGMFLMCSMLLWFWVQLFYGPREPTWILPSRDEAPRRPFYKEREVTPPRRPFYKEREITSPRRVYRPQPPPMRYDPRPMYDEPPRRPLVTERLQPGLQPKMHTVPEAPLRVVNEVREVVNVPAEKPLIPGPPPPTQVIVEKKIAPTPKRHYVPPVSAHVDFSRTFP